MLSFGNLFATQFTLSINNAHPLDGRLSCVGIGIEFHTKSNSNFVRGIVPVAGFQRMGQRNRRGLITYHPMLEMQIDDNGAWYCVIIHG